MANTNPKLFSLLSPNLDDGYIPSNPVDTNREIPKKMDIFYRTEEDFVPEGKTLSSLTAAETKLVKKKYRFDPFKPGIYQGITGFGKMIN